MEAEHTLVPRTMFSTTPFGVTTSKYEVRRSAEVRPHRRCPSKQAGVSDAGKGQATPLDCQVLAP